ncbi:MAG TPA: protein kinase [Kofleriaceae bacterium]|nr:protein kinase [Kofleriaceae bacterium]
MDGGGMIGQYRVTGLIGRGGMGAVYAGEHALLGRPAAIKVLLPDLSQKQDVVMRFFNEARAATAIRHPGIIEIYDFGWTPDGAAFIVMERLDGETLAGRLARGRFAWPAAFAIARQIAGALAAAHGKSIVHRDLKPDNIFLVADPEVPGGERIKLLDFGIAKLAGETHATGNMTKTGAVMGTPTYMAPEQCRGVAVDHRADLYALGCVMFELCAGRPPFVGEGSGDVLAAHIHVPVPSLASLGVVLPAPVEAVIQRLLAKAPAERLPSAEAVIQAIDAVADRSLHATGMRPSIGRPGTTAPDVTTLSGAASMHLARAPGRGKRTIAIAAGAAVVVGAIGVIAATAGRDERASVRYGELQAKAGSAVAAGAAPEPAMKAPEPAVKTPEPTVMKAEPAVTKPAEPAVKAPEPAVKPPEPAAKPAEPAVAKPPEPAVAKPATPAPAPQAIDIDTTPPGATVSLGGEVLGKTPLHTTLARARDATLVIHAPGYADRGVTFHAGKPVKETFELVKLAPRPARPAKPVDRDQSVNPFGD